MPEQITLSQPAWNLIDALQQQLDVRIEVLDVSMRPLVAAAAVEGPSAIDEPRLAAETLKSLRTGELRIDRSTGVTVGIFPLRVAKQVAGCLVVSPRRPAGEAAPASVNVEGAGSIARTALESDLALTQQLDEARHRHRRVHGVLRFLAQVGGSLDERAVMHAVVQAATVWFDLDCRIYHRYPDDTYALAAVLPGIERPAAGTRLDGARVDKLIASRRFSSGGDLDDLGLVGRRDEVLVLPVGAAGAPDWLVILAGTIDQEVELTFAALTKVLTGELQARELARLARWERRLTDTRQDERRAPERTLFLLVEALAADVGAHAASLTLITDGEARALAAFGERQAAQASPEERAAPPADEDVPPYVRALQIAPGTLVQLRLESRGDPRVVLVQAESWMRALQLWLGEVATRLVEQPPVFEAVVAALPSFERRIEEEVERARRFNLGLGLVLIAPAPEGPGGPGLDPIVSTVRSQLRASDLMGRLRSGAVAVLLVHAEPIGAESVIARIRERLASDARAEGIAALRLGRAVFSAECGSAGELIARAHVEAQRFELRN